MRNDDPYKVYDPDYLESGYDEDDPEVRPPGAIRRAVIAMLAGAMVGYLLGANPVIGVVAWLVIWVLAEARARG